jgi:hypothetical protein
MKLLPITGMRNGKIGIVVGYSKVDDEDFNILKEYKWSLDGDRGNSYLRNKKLGAIHRFIMKCPKNKEVDHINRDRSDNRKQNLRICTRSQNMMNRTKYKNGKTGYKNIGFVNKRKSCHPWYVGIRKDKKHYYLGSYKTLKEAIKVRNKALKKLHGEFARYN